MIHAKVLLIGCRWLAFKVRGVDTGLYTLPSALQLPRRSPDTDFLHLPTALKDLLTFQCVICSCCLPFQNVHGDAEATILKIS